MDQASEDGLFCILDYFLACLRHTDPDLLHQAEYDAVIVFDARKWKEGGCPHSASVGDTSSLPLFHWGYAIQRIIATIPD
jgi:hypothetical protein